MITTLKIKNIALIRELELPLNAGLNVLSGETGAGKSIIIDSLNFALGSKADKGLIRHGESFASVQVSFFLNGNVEEINMIFDELGISFEETIIIGRTMQENGRSECRINGQLATLAQLKRVVSLLIDVHSQHENQALLNEANHIKILDNYSKAIKELKSEFNLHLSSYKDLKEEYKSFPSSDERLRQIDILEYQIDEIKRANLLDNEEEELIEKRNKLNNHQRIIMSVNSAYGLLNGFEEMPGAASIVSQASNELNYIERYLNEVKELTERLKSIKIEINDISDTLSGILNDEFDISELELVEKRIEEIRKIKKRYGNNVSEINDFLFNAEKEYERLQSANERIEKLDGLILNKEKDVLRFARMLHDERVKVSKSFEESVVKNLKDLGMTSSTFKVEIAFPKNDAEVIDKLVPNCAADAVKFMISPNLGEPLKPLAKIASGGEMSRFMLGLKNITAELEDIDTLVFDEIDSGISGKMAKIVAEKLYNIAKDRQVIAVTHLPQLASMSDAMYLITKKEFDSQTHTYIDLQQEEGVLKEIMRLSGSKEDSDSGLLAAKEMRLEAKNYKTLLNQFKAN